MKKFALLAIAGVVSAWIGGLLFLLWVFREWEDTTRELMP